MYFHVVDALQIAGGKVATAAKLWEPHVVADRELITGQNPGSDKALATALVEALDRQCAGANAA
jgi:putative intracellular protease/amidase